MSCDPVIHSIPGRCRLRIDQIAIARQFTDRLKRLIESWEMAITVRINPAARSLIFTYKEEAITTEVPDNYLIS